MFFTTEIPFDKLRAGGENLRTQGLGERRICYNSNVFTAEVAEERRGKALNLGLGERRDCYSGDVFHHSLSRRRSKNEDGRKMRTQRKPKTRGKPFVIPDITSIT
jgi:hypothetical protein